MTNAKKLETVDILFELKKLEVFRKQRMSIQAVAVYVDAAKSAGTREVLSKVITDLAKYGDRFPHPRDIINGIVQEQKQSAPREQCEQCGGTGFITRKKSFSGKNPVLRDMYAGLAIDTSEECPNCKSQLAASTDDSERQSKQRKSDLRTFSGVKAEQDSNATKESLFDEE
jgi:transposase-like protein